LQPTTEILERISKDSLTHKEEVFTRLYRYLLRPDIYYQAYQRLYTNKGASTKGINQDTADGFSEAKIEKIIQSLADETYQPTPVRRTYIAKKSNPKKKRPFLEAHREEITLHKAAKAAFDEAGLQKLPKVKALDAEFTELLTKKKAAYPDYRKARNEMQELVRAQKNVERFFAEEKPAQENEQAR